MQLVTSLRLSGLKLHMWVAAMLDSEPAAIGGKLLWPVTTDLVETFVGNLYINSITGTATETLDAHYSMKNALNSGRLKLP